MTIHESQETRIALLENNHKMFMNKFEDVFKRFDKLDKKLTESEQKLDIAINKKADKTTVEDIQKTIRWVTYTVVGAVLLAIIKVTLKI